MLQLKEINEKISLKTDDESAASRGKIFQTYCMKVCAKVLILC